MTRKLGVIGSMVWDEIFCRDPISAPVHEWGGIGYALGGLDAALDDDWEIVPLIKVGNDLAGEAARFLEDIRHKAPTARFIEVPALNNRVTLHYREGERRTERMSGGVPGWTWPELGPLVRDLDALYLNFISGFELDLGTATALRRGYDGPIYADLHSLFLGFDPAAMRVPQPLSNPGAWFGCFDFVQLNEDEMQQLGTDPMSVAASVIAAGVALLAVTLGSRGAAYFAAADPALGETAGTIRTALIEAPVVDAIDPTGCGDVFGATAFARMLGGDDVETALRAAVSAASRNATFRGATGLARHLRGQLVEG
ncbi:MAG TPA: carbohydrate kinase family protein [Gemmatimonadales bacterium]|nr:carbohydrate kinase family protein [Gemmatimonadales bacterium]